jgi:hypothetical protein
LDARLSVTREQAAAIDIATVQWLKRSPTSTLRDRLELLDRAAPPESLARLVREREQLARRAEELALQLAGTESKIEKLRRSRPSRLRRAAWSIHRSSEDLHDRSYNGLSRIRASVLRDIEQRDESIRRLRGRPDDAIVQTERAQIRNELARRRAVETALEQSTEKDRLRLSR